MLLVEHQMCFWYHIPKMVSLLLTGVYCFHCVKQNIPSFRPHWNGNLAGLCIIFLRRRKEMLEAWSFCCMFCQWLVCWFFHGLLIRISQWSWLFWVTYSKRIWTWNHQRTSLTISCTLGIFCWVWIGWSVVELIWTRQVRLEAFWWHPTMAEDRDHLWDGGTTKWWTKWQVSEALSRKSSWFIMVFGSLCFKFYTAFWSWSSTNYFKPRFGRFFLFGWFLHHFGVNFLLGKSAIRYLCYTTFVNAASQDHHWCNWAALGHIGRKIHRRVIQNAYLEQVQKQTCKMSTGYTVEVSLLHLCSSVWDFNWLSSFRLRKKLFFNMT